MSAEIINSENIQRLIDFLFSGIGVAAVGFLYHNVKKRIENCKYDWKPKEPIKNRKSVKKISEHKKTIQLDENNDIMLNTPLIGGEQAFLQNLHNFISTERYKYPIYSDDFGIEEAKTIFMVTDKEEFYRQCEKIANHTIEYFNEWIEEIFRIHRDKTKENLYIELKVKGRPNTLICKVPNYYKRTVGKD